MALYDIQIEVRELRDGGDYRYVATSPDLPNLIVAGDTAEEVIALVPDVAAALIASMQAAGDALPPTLREIPSPPFSSHITVPA